MIWRSTHWTYWDETWCKNVLAHKGPRSEPVVWVTPLLLLSTMTLKIIEVDKLLSRYQARSRGGRWGCESWTSFASAAVQQTLYLWLPHTAVETAIAQCTSCWAMARGHHLNTSIVLAAVHGLSSLFWAVSAVEPSLFPPLFPLSPSLISHLASVDIKQNVLQLLCKVNGRQCQLGERVAM